LVARRLALQKMLRKFTNAFRLKQKTLESNSKSHKEIKNTGKGNNIGKYK
jgi:hypothetical protein